MLADPDHAGRSASRVHGPAAVESADDEDETLGATGEVERDSGWLRAGRITSGSLAGEAATRNELLWREKNITEEALRSRSATLYYSRLTLAALRTDATN